MTIIIFVVLAGSPFYVAWLYLCPFRPCPRCSGRGTNVFSSGKRFGDCGRCKGTRRVQRIGSRQVHRAVLAARGRKTK